jgi:hypothetical protein
VSTKALIVGGLLTAAALWFFVFRDTRLSANETARALQAKLHTPYSFRCRPMAGDESIPVSDVDYACLAKNGGDSYWVGTENTWFRSGITDLVMMGP